MPITNFVFAIVLMILAEVVTRRARHRRPNLGRMLEGHQEILHIPTRRAHAQKLVAWTTSRLDALTREIDKLTSRLLNRLPLPDDLASSATAYITLVLVTFIGECGVAWLLNTSSQFAGLGASTLAFISPLMAGAMVQMARGVVHGAVLIGATHRPGRRLMRAKTAVFVFTALSLAGAWLVFAGRSIINPTLIDLVANYGLHVLGVFTALAGGAAHVTYSILMEEQELDHDLHYSTTLKKDLTTFMHDLEQDLAQHHPAGAAQPAPAAQPAAAPIPATPANVTAGQVAAASIAALLFLPAAALAQSATAQATVLVASGQVVRSATIDRPAVSARLTPDSCEVLFDSSASQDVEMRTAAISTFVEQFPTIVELYACRIVRASSFVGEAPFNPVEERALPALAGLTDCTATVAAMPVDVLYPRARSARLAQAEASCASAHEDAREAAAERRHRTVGSVQRMLRGVAKRGGRGTCTALVQAAARAVARSQFVWVISDGHQSCPTPNGWMPVSARGRLFLLLVPTTAPFDEHAPTRALEHAERLYTLFPGAEVLFTPEITPSTWATLRR
jgi:hypothetical protein